LSGASRTARANRPLLRGLYQGRSSAVADSDDIESAKSQKTKRNTSRGRKGAPSSRKGAMPPSRSRGTASLGARTASVRLQKTSDDSSVALSQTGTDDDDASSSSNSSNTPKSGTVPSSRTVRSAAKGSGSSRGTRGTAPPSRRAASGPPLSPAATTGKGRRSGSSSLRAPSSPSTMSTRSGGRALPKVGLPLSPNLAFDDEEDLKTRSSA